MKTNQSTSSGRCSQRFLALAVGAALAVGWGAGAACGAEHPEHPTQTPKARVASSVKLENVAAYIERYVKGSSKDGLFPITDKSTKQKLSLKLEKVHRERLAQVGPDMFFVCADFTTAEGNHTYDVDFFVQGKSKDDLAVLEKKSSIHKEDGKERYTWTFNAKKGVWEQKPVGTKAKAGSGPEHP
jgi:hypothetical protein